MVDLKTLADRRAEILHLAQRYGASDLRIFGSVANGQANSESDVDFLIKTGPNCSLLDLGGLLEDLQELLHCRVDLVPENSLKPNLKERILREAIAL